MEIIGIGYVIGFFVYLLRYATETYESINEGAGTRVFMTLLMLLSVGLFYAMCWPIIWLLEWNNQQNKELQDRVDEARRNKQ